MSKASFRGKRLNHSKGGKSFKEIEELEQAKISLNEFVVRSLKVFEKSFKNMKLQKKKLKDNAFVYTLQIFYDVCVFGRFI